MADFSDAEDKQLIQLALVYEAAKTRIAWKTIEIMMQAKRRNAHRLTAVKLKMRLKTLKNRFGASLAHFPPRYLPPAPSANVDLVATQSTGAVDAANALCETNLLMEFERMLAQSSSAPNDRAPKDPSLRRLPISSREADLPTMSTQTVQCLSVEIFKTITRAEVRQGRQEENVGELTVAGVSLLTKACAFTVHDVFVDVGSGVGNVIAQVALESSVKLAVGVEIRETIAVKGQQLIREWACQHPRLNDVHILASDIRKVAIDRDPMFEAATVLYCHNTLFKPAVQQGIEELCCQLQQLRIVVLQIPFCPRHTPRCTKRFCLAFTTREIVSWPVSFTANGALFTVYDRSRMVV